MLSCTGWHTILRTVKGGRVVSVNVRKTRKGEIGGVGKYRQSRQCHYGLIAAVLLPIVGEVH